MFAPARRGRISDNVADQIRRRVEEWGLNPGDRLPPERELAARLGVGRTSVREGVRTLELSGFVDVIPSKGVYLKEDAGGQMDRLVTGWLTVDRGGVLELIELRAALEGQAAALAAVRATPVELATIERAVATMRAIVQTGDPDSFAANDAAFHDAIARASRNGLLRRALATIAQETAAHAQAAAGLGELPRSRILDDHAEILDAIQARDGARANAAMDRHIAQVAIDLGVSEGE